MIKDKIINLYTEMDMHDKEFMIGLLAKDIFVPVVIDYQDGGKTLTHCMDLDREMPVCFNGASLQLNLEDTVKVKYVETKDYKQALDLVKKVEKDVNKLVKNK